MLASLIAAFASGETILALRRARNAAIAYAIAGICAAVGAVFLLVAAYVGASRHFGSIHAALGAGAVFIVVALLILLVHWLMSGRRARRAARQRNSDMTKIAIATGLAVLPSLLKGRSAATLLAAPAIAAVAFAIFQENRKKSPSGDPD